MKESRLIFATLKKGQLPLNQRAANATVAVQSAGLANRGLAPTATRDSTQQNYMDGAATPYVRPTVDTSQGQSLLNERNSVLNNSANGLASTVTQGNIDPTTGERSQSPVQAAAPVGSDSVIADSAKARQQNEGATPAQIQTNKQNLLGIMDYHPPGWVDTSHLQPTQTSDGAITETPAEFAARKAAIEQQNTEKLNQHIAAKAQANEQNTAPPPTTPTSGPQPDQTTTGAPGAMPPPDHSADIASGMTAQMKQMMMGDPELASAMAPILAQLQANDKTNNANVDATEAKIGDGSILASAVKDNKDALERSTIRQEQAADASQKLALDTAEANKEALQAQKDLFEAKQVMQENEQRKVNIENELKNRRTANKLGVAQDTNGLKWMQDEVAKGNDQLNYLTQSGSAVRQGYMIQITQGYQNEVNKAMNDHEQAYNGIEANYTKSLYEQTQMLNTNQTEIRKEREGLEEKRWDMHNQNDIKAADIMATLNGKLFDRVSNVQKQEFTKTLLDTRMTAMKEMLGTKLTNTDQQGDLNRQNALKIASAGAVKTVAAAVDTTTKDIRTQADRDIQPYIDFMDKYNGFAAAAKQAATNPNAVTSQMMQDMLAQMQSTKATSRMPQGTVKLLTDNMSLAQKIQGEIGKFKGNGALPVDVVNDAITMANNLKQIKEEEAQEAYAPYLLQIADHNAKIKAQFAGTDVSPEMLQSMMIDPQAVINSRVKIPLTSQDDDEAKYKELSGQGGGSVATEPDFKSYASSLGTVSQDYNGTYDQTHGINFADGRQTHQAYDIAGKLGAPIPSFQGGKVILAATGSKGLGNHVVIQGDDGYKYIYGHMQSLNVKTGDTVSAKDILGKLGSTGASTGPHVHFEVQDGHGNRMDPMTWQSQGNTDWASAPTDSSSNGMDMRKFLIASMMLDPLELSAYSE